MKTFIRFINSTLWTIFCLCMAGIGIYSAVSWLNDLKEHWSWMGNHVEIDLDEDGDV